ncbi:TPA: DUF2877 domain-containing protein [Klebsiella pneumoniae]|nr:DUF2877 domain-containing protein [Klebsiella pneumoniae]HBV3181792.1 DUF2877 domain-containing protein [Klebsiella pneumoniae]HBV6764619.1 DUF2877 domain-containing protein [Klebsiella pneumoniae]
MTSLTLIPVTVGYLAIDRLNDAGNQQINVHSCFANTMNLLLSDGELLILASEHTGLNHPDTIIVSVPANWDWRCTGRAGITFGDGIFSNPVWQMDIRHVKRWQQTDLYPLIMTETERKYTFLAEQLKVYSQRYPIKSAIMLLPDNMAKQVNRPLREVNIAIEDNEQQISQLVDGLIGFGFGLTPDGDDYLLGYLAAISFLPQDIISRHRRALTRIIISRLDRTNDISQHYLKRATEGHFSEAICQLLTHLSAPFSPSPLAAAATAVMRFGASSGVDCLAGLLHGIRASTRIH